MSQENVEVVQAQHASFGRVAEGGKVHSWVLGYFDPNCEYRPVEEVDAIRGHEALIEWTERWLEAWSSYTEQVEEIIDGGEIVVAAVSISGRGRTSGVEIRQRFFHVFEMREGRIFGSASDRLSPAWRNRRRARRHRVPTDRLQAHQPARSRDRDSGRGIPPCE
jgi:ketosteroid isomerase-like protein